MKLSYISLVCSIFFIALTPLASATPLPSNITAEYLVEYFENERNSLAEVFCKKAKLLSEKLLLHKDLQEASTTELKDYKINLQDFLHDYPHFEQYHIYEPLVRILWNVINLDYNNNPKSELKFKEIMKKDFSNTFKEYEENYERFFKEKFLPKIIEYKENMDPVKSEKLSKFLVFVENLKTCHNYSCLPKNLDTFIESMNPPKTLIIKYTNIDLKTLIILIAIRQNEAGSMIMKDSLNSELSSEPKEIFSHDIKDFMLKFQNNTDIEKFWSEMKENIYVSREYLKRKNFPSKDQELLDSILVKYNDVSEKSEFIFESKNMASNLAVRLLFIALAYPDSYEDFHMIW